MEKFAIDLDKVLDDFELDEDENEGASQYDKLQLEFCDTHTEATGADTLHGNYESNNGNNWMATVSEVIPGTRSPPDGQHDDNSASDVLAIDVTRGGGPAINKMEDSLLCDLGTSPPNEIVAPAVEPRENCANYASLLSNDLLWPQFSAGGVFNTCGAAAASGAIDTTAAGPHRNCDIANDVRLGSENGRLDVLPEVFAPATYMQPNDHQESNHPDIINQGNCTNQPLQRDTATPHGAEGVVDRANSTVVTDLVSSTQHEGALLPDLMFSNSACLLADQSTPAVVTENFPSSSRGGTAEPAIIRESLPANRLPEVTNVHQSAELGFKNRPELLVRVRDEAASVVEHSQPAPPTADLPPERGERANRALDQGTLPDVSLTGGTDDTIAAKYSPRSENAIRFNPDLQIDHDELAANIGDLEAELEAYSVASGSQSQPAEIHVHNSLPEPDIVSVEPASGDGGSESEAAGDAICTAAANSSIETKEPISAPSLAQFSQYQLAPTETCDIPSINTLEVCASSSSTLPREVPEAAAASDLARPPDGTEEGSSGSSGTDTTSSSSTLVGDFDPAESGNFSALVSPEEETHNDPCVNTAEQLDEEETPPDAADDDDENGASAYEPTETNPAVGTVAPFWVPDKDAANCQECGTKFTLIRRRHHCRACGRVLCSFCCHSKAPLPYLDFKEERVCETCLLLLTETYNPDDSESDAAQARLPNPNNPMEYCSRISPLQQAAASGAVPPPTVMVPVGILKRDQANYRGANSGRARVNKQVIFMDGIQPGGDLQEVGSSGQQTVASYRRGDRSSRRVVTALPEEGSTKVSSRVGTQRGKLSSNALDRCLIPEGGGLPPVLLSSPCTGEYNFDQSPDSQKLEEQLRGDGPPVVFAIMKNLTVLVKKIKLTCCIGMEVWNLATRGLCAVGQDELVILIEALPEERAPPAQLFTFFYSVYQQANKGNLVTELGHTIFTEPEGFLGSKDHAGFLYIKPSFQCLNKLLLPPAPYIFAVLIQKWETPWAKVFPLRLMLRLGAEFRYYPCPLVSSRNRKPVFGEIGHTIMNLLVDFRNYAFTIPLVQGFTIHMEDKKTTLLIPRNRYDQVCKALDNSNDHVLALAANFSPQADSHLVTVEDDDGNYSTQAINIHNRPRKVTGASFIVFNGALKTTSGLRGKSSIVEDGLMVQIHGDMMTSLRDALRNLNDFDLQCGQTSSTEPEEVVVIRWIEDDKSFNVGIRSAVDDRAMDGVPSIKVHSVPDYASKHHIIRWTEIFIMQEENANGHSDINISRLSEALSRACCIALIPHLHELFATGQTKVALRTTLHQENVEYEIGSGGGRLPPLFMNSLDTELIPVIHQSAANITDQPVILELVFHILEQ